MAKSKMSAFQNYISTIAIEDMMTQSDSCFEDVKNNDLVIAVIPGSWVFVGFLTQLENRKIRLDCCHNIHRWGTEHGLGELAITGPLKETILHESGPIFVEPIFLIKADITKW